MFIQTTGQLQKSTTDDSYYGSKFKIQNYGSRYITYHLLQSITLSNQFLSQLSLSLSLKFNFALSNPDHTIKSKSAIDIRTLSSTTHHFSIGVW
ncbi:hypothetical protein HanOQP8_Chr17g0665561 [Helianthus annuus]|nr:hypothetical protein HanOQP8_Chr17g0665561 [Helianthus annuus]